MASRDESNMDPYASEDESEDSGIQQLLELGYEQLDAFVLWLENYLELDIRTSQQDCFNAEFLLDYLANTFHKSAVEINEFEARWFLFSHYLRKAMADTETEERMPASLERFFRFLEAKYDYTIPDWLLEALREQTTYLRRRHEYAMLDRNNELVWRAGYRRWCAELEDDLDGRCLWLPQDMGKGMTWQERAGWREASLREMATRLWMEERQMLLEEGWDMEVVRTRLTETYLIWLDSPLDVLEAETPREVIVQERLDRAETEGEADTEER